MTRWKIDENDRLPIGVIEDTEDGEGVCVMEYDSGTKDKKILGAVRTEAESIVRDHNRAEAFAVAYDFVYRVANGLLTADVKLAAQSVLKTMKEDK